MPAKSDLWTSHSAVYDTDAAARLWEDGRQVQFLSYAPYRMPSHPTWSEDPHQNLSWQTLYQSLTWLQAPARAYLTTGDSRYQDEVRDYLLSWIAATPKDHPPSPRSWYDGAVGYRTDVIVELFTPVLSGVLTPAEAEKVLALLEYQGQLLDGYLAQPRFVGHNHALFHALSLYNLAVAFPELGHASTWRTDARARISSLLPEMVDTGEGVSLEQAAHYHYLALRLFWEADTYLRNYNDGLSQGELAILGKMTAFGALLLTPTMDVPAIGDTGYGQAADTSLFDQLAADGITSPTAEFILSRGARGSRPPDASFFPTAGYAIIRPQYSVPAQWANDLQLIVDTTTKSKAHGHDDAMNVLLHARGAGLLIDSGGPYKYGDPGRAAFVGATAHNTVVNDGSNGLGPVADLVETDDAQHSVIAGTFATGKGAEDRRVVVLLKPDTLIIVDLVRSTDGKAHDYQLLYHLPPASTIVSQGTAGIVTVKPAAMGFRVVTADTALLSVPKGQKNPLLGWVTHGSKGLKTPAPVLDVSQRATSTWYVSVFQPADLGAAAIPDVGVQSSHNGLVITVQSAGIRTVLDVASDGGVTLAAR